MHLSQRLIITVFAFASCSAGASKEDWQRLRDQIEQRLHVAQPPPKLEDKSYGRFQPAPDVAAERVSYTTAYGIRVPAIVYREAGPTVVQHPALIIVNGHRGDKSSWYATWAGMLYARAGAVVLTYDPIGEFERNRDRRSGTSEHDTYIPPDDMARRLSGLMITDVMQAVTYLSGRRDVDKKRVAVLGYSMGSFVSSLACALDTRVHACVLTGGGDLDGPEGYWDNSNKMCQAIPYRSLSFLAERGPAIYSLNARRGPTLVFNGSSDEVVDIPHHGQAWFEQLRRQTVEKLGTSKDVFEAAFAADSGHRPYFLTRPVALWLEDKLKFPNWTRKQIEAMPETHISEWASQNGLSASASTANEHHEGGTMALGDRIPAIPREQLHAIPEVVWDAQLNDYIYQTWVERAQAAIRSGAP